jgi:hypothetical protein
MSMILFDELYRQHGAATEQTYRLKQGKAAGIVVLSDIALYSCFV